MRATIWKGLTEFQRDFLLRVSPFERYTLKQAAFLLNLSCGALNPDGIPQFLMDVSEDRAFVHRLSTEPFYHPHSRVLDFLRAELAGDRNFYGEVLGRAAEWCVENGEPEIAVNFFLLNGKHDRALSVDTLGREMIPPEGMTYEELTVLLVENSSDEAKLKYPAHFLKHAFDLLDVGRIDIFFAALERMRRLISESGMPEGERGRIMGEITFLSSFGEYNDISKMASLMRSAHGLIGGRPSLIRMNDTWTFGNASVMFMFHSEPGRLGGELAGMKEGCGYYFAMTGGHGSGGDALMEAEALFNRGDSEKIASIARGALNLADVRHQTSVAIGACFLLAREAMTRGDAEAFAGYRKRVNEYPKRSGLKSDRQEAEMADCWLLSAFGRARVPGVPQYFQAAPFYRVTLGKTIMSSGDAEYRGDEWLGMAGEAIGVARALRSELAVIYCGILTASAHMSLGDEKKASSALAEALESAMPDRLYMPFAEHYSALAPLIEKTARPEDSERIRFLASKFIAGRKAIMSAIAKNEPLGLSEREYRVARMASRDMSNSQIAEQMRLSVNTVKFHLKSVYRKTGASSRGDLGNIFRADADTSI
jgi:LuxR family maltose regulon positive regulatory protein